MSGLSPRLSSQQFFLSKICREIFYPNLLRFVRDLYGEAMLEPIRMGTSMAAGNQQKHLSLSFATKVRIYRSRN